MTPAAIFLPTNPEATVFSMTDLAIEGMRSGLRLYTNGRQLALLPKPAPGWALFAIKTKPTTPEAA